jgi:hypothetical protein
MAGEIDVVTYKEIAAYGAKLQSMKLNEAHFYADTPKACQRSTGDPGHSN